MRRQRWAGALFLVTGAGLVVHIVIGLPLWLTVLGGLVLGGAGLSWAGVLTGANLRPVVSAGLVAGAVATVGHDVSRVLVTEVLGANIRPFEAWRFFGQGLVGPSASETVHWIAGGLFHVTNGLAFALAYAVWFGTRSAVMGIALGLFLEAFALGSSFAIGALVAGRWQARYTA